MGLLDTVSRVTTVYKADVSDHVKELQKLKGEQKAATKEQLDQARSTNEALEKQIKTLGKVALAVGTAVAAGKIAWDAYQHVVEKSRLETAAMGVDIGRLQQASGGLKTRMDLLRDAAMLQRSAFKLTGTQMVSVEKAMLGLTRAGFDQAEVTKKVTEAIVKLDGGGLKNFGIRVREATSDGDKFAAIMEAIEAKARGVNTTTAGTAESVASMGVKFRDSMDTIQTSIGRIVVALGPLIEKVASLADAVAGAAEGEDNFLSRISGAYTPAVEMARGIARAQAAKSYFSFEDQDPTLLKELQKSDPGLAIFLGGVRGGRTADAERRSAEIQSQVAALIAEQQQIFRDAGRSAGSRRSGGGSGGRRNATRAEAYSGISVYDATAGNVGAGGTQGFGAVNGSAIDGWDIRQGIGEIASDRQAEADALLERMNEIQAKAAEAASAQRTSMLESVFGPVGQFDAYAKGFEMLTGAVGTAYDAWISGSMGAGEAVKKFLGDAIAASGKQMAIEALKYGAYAIASVVPGPFFNPGAAAGYAATAAAFAGGALVAGVVSRELGAGGSQPPTSASGARGAAPTLPAGGGPIERTERTIVIGNSFSEDTPRMRQLRAERIWNDAKGSGGTVYS